MFLHHALMIMEVEFEEGAESAEHSHPHEQISYCLRGEFEYRLDGRPMRLHAGESLIIPGGTRHSAKALTRGRCWMRSRRCAKIWRERERPLALAF